MGSPLLFVRAKLSLHKYAVDSTIVEFVEFDLEEQEGAASSRTVSG